MPSCARFKAMVLLVLALIALANAGCNNNWNWWWVGSRTQWNVTKDFYIGLDVAYTKIQSATHVGWRVTYGPLSRRVPTPEPGLSPTQTTGRRASACIATSIRDRLIVDL